MFGNLMQLGEAVVRIKADDELFLRQVQKLDSAFVAMGSRADGAMKGVAIGMRAIGAGMGAAAALAGSALVIAARMTNHWNELQKSVGATTTQMRTLREEVYKIAEKTPGLDLTRAVDLAAAVGRMGVGAGLSPEAHADAVAKFTAELADLKPALDMPLEHFASEVLYLQKVMGLGTDKTTSFASALIGLDKASRASQSEILGTAKALAPAFQELGASIEDLLPFAAQIAEVDAGPMVMSRLLDNMVHDVRKYAMYAHMDVEEFSKYLETRPVQAVQTWIKAFGKLDDKSKFWLARDLGINKRMLDRFLAVSHSGNGPDFADIAGAEWAGHGSVKQAQALDKNTLGASLESIQDNLTRTGDVIGRAILPIVKYVADGFKSWAEFIRVNEDVVTAFFSGMKDGLSNLASVAVTTWHAIEDAWDSGLLGLIGRLAILGPDLAAIWRHGGEAVTAFQDLAVAAIKGVGEAMSWLARAAVPVAVNVGTLLKDAFQVAAEYAHTTFRLFFEWLAKRGSDAMLWFTNPLGAALKGNSDATSFKDIFNHGVDLRGRFDVSKLAPLPTFDQGGQLAESFTAALRRNGSVWQSIGSEMSRGVVQGWEEFERLRADRAKREAEDQEKAAAAAAKKNDVEDFKNWMAWNIAAGFDGDKFMQETGGRRRRRGNDGGIGLLEMSTMLGSGFDFGHRGTLTDLSHASALGNINPLLMSLSENKKAAEDQTAATRDQTEQMKKGVPVRVGK